MSENTNTNANNEQNDLNINIKNLEELNYSFSALNKPNENIQKPKINNNNNNSNIIQQKEINKKNSLSKGQILGGQFILGEEIGKGTFGLVKTATHIITGEKVAVKMLYKEKILKDESERKRLEKEIKILKILRHRNIVQLYNVFQTSSTIFLVMEYIQGKELFEIIIKKKRLSELESLFYFQQLISGIEYLGKLGIAHRDLKPENLLINSKKELKIADFGLSNTYKKNQLLSTPCGSPSYAAPEMLSGENYFGLAADIWSCGIILFTMLCGRLPFEDKDNSKLYEKIKQGKFIIPDYISEIGKDFLVKILNSDPKKRYNIIQIKKHPWFNQLDQNKYMTRGLLLNKYIVPIDEEIVEKMIKEYDYKEKEIKMNLLANKHNHITTTYYLFLKQKIKNGKHSVADMVHSEFINYIHNPKNFLANYNGDWNKLFKERANKKVLISEPKLNFSKRNSKKIEINDKKENEIILDKNIFDNNNNNDKNIINKTANNNNEFKEKIEEIYKKRNEQIINNNKKNIPKKEKSLDSNKIKKLKVYTKLKSFDKTEKIITINLGEIKSNKNKKNFSPFNPNKTNINTNINFKRKININNNTYNKTLTIIKKAPMINNKNKILNKKEENKKKIKRKTISNKIKNISLETNINNININKKNQKDNSIKFRNFTYKSNTEKIKIKNKNKK